MMLVRATPCWQFYDHVQKRWMSVFCNEVLTRSGCMLCQCCAGEGCVGAAGNQCYAPAQLPLFENTLLQLLHSTRVPVSPRSTLLPGLNFKSSLRASPTLPTGYQHCPVVLCSTSKTAVHEPHKSITPDLHERQRLTGPLWHCRSSTCARASAS
jgi:hypothetical protein